MFWRFYSTVVSFLFNVVLWHELDVTSMPDATGVTLLVTANIRSTKVKNPNNTSCKSSWLDLKWHPRLIQLAGVHVYCLVRSHRSFAGQKACFAVLDKVLGIRVNSWCLCHQTAEQQDCLVRSRRSVFCLYERSICLNLMSCGAWQTDVVRQRASSHCAPRHVLPCTRISFARLNTPLMMLEAFGRIEK